MSRQSLTYNSKFETLAEGFEYLNYGTYVVQVGAQFDTGRGQIEVFQLNSQGRLNE